MIYMQSALDRSNINRLDMVESMALPPIHADLLKNDQIDAELLKAFEDVLYKAEDGYLRAIDTDRRAFIGIASSDTIDTHGEIVDLEALRKTLPTLMEMGGDIQYEHSNLKGGRILKHKNANLLHKGKNIDSVLLAFEMFDFYPSQRKMLERMDLPDGHPQKLDMLSVGGKKLKKARECQDNVCYNRITELESHEFTVTTQGANNLSYILAKSEKNMLDKSKLTITADTGDVEEDSLNKSHGKDCNCGESNPSTNASDLNKSKKDDKLNKMSEEDEEEEDDEEEDDDMTKMAKAITSIAKSVNQLTIEVNDLKKSQTTTEPAKPKGKPKSQLDILSDQVSLLTKSVEDIRTAEITPQMAITSQNPQGDPIASDPLKKRAVELSNMSLLEKMNTSLRANATGRSQLERMGYVVQD